MSITSKNANLGIKLFFILFLSLLIIKISGIELGGKLSWSLVVLPLWLPITLVISFVIIKGIVSRIKYKIRNKRFKKRYGLYVETTNKITFKSIKTQVLKQENNLINK